MMEKIIAKLRGEISQYFQRFGPHDFSHTQRVYNCALLLGKSYNADMEVVAFASLLHDIARLREQADKSICHANEGARMAAEILNGRSIKVDNIAYCIKTHRFKKNILPETLEAKILQDADRLDALGAVTIARTFSQDGMDGKPIYDPDITPNKEYTGSSKTGINHIYEKILKIRPENFHTEKAREIAKGRYLFVQEFVEQFEAEWCASR